MVTQALPTAEHWGHSIISLKGRAYQGQGIQGSLVTVSTVLEDSLVLLKASAGPQEYQQCGAMERGQ